jgi:hypothetical protein
MSSRIANEKYEILADGYQSRLRALEVDRGKEEEERNWRYLCRLILHTIFLVFDVSCANY